QARVATRSPALASGYHPEILAFFADGDVPYPPDLVHNHELGSIFYLEALTVLAAIFWAEDQPDRPRRLLIYTDSMNTVDMFHSMRADPGIIRSSWRQ
ncbi:hypothetical protein M408DRAFT_123195, partial [Serendipita vermifera MAFF 305830]